MKKAFHFLALASILSATTSRENYGESVSTPKRKVPKKDTKSNLFCYWFREDGTFLNERQEEKMKVEECVFVCYATTNNSAIKKFNKFKTNLDGRIKL